MFYLKYRPQSIAEIDNKEVGTRMTTLLMAEKIPHSFLFTGPKGTGKTSSARIFAKAVNCETNLFAQGKGTIEPCNTCHNCRSITAGNAIDVVEIDGASARKIDDIRNLIDSVKFMPVAQRYKIYIVDEVHMLTHEAFNAFLKTLEEPPSKTIFILATTDPDALPSTIISRCIRVHFHKAKKNEIVAMLARIARGEDVSVNDEVYKAIASFSDYSFRDGAKIFEEAVAKVKETKKKGKISLSVEDIHAIVGLGKDTIRLFTSLEKHDTHKSLEYIEEYAEKGGDCKRLIEMMLDSMHALLLKKSNLKIDFDIQYQFTLSEITLLIKLLQEAYTMMNYSPIETLPLEIAIVEYINKFKVPNTKSQINSKS